MSRRWLPRFLLVAFVVTFASSVHSEITIDATPSGEDAAAAFRSNLTAPAPARAIRFLYSLNHIPDHTDPLAPKYRNGFCELAGALQSSGFFLSEISNSIVSAAIIAPYGHGMVCGVSKDFWWSLLDGADSCQIAPRIEDGIAPTGSPVYIMCSVFSNIVAEVLRGGVRNFADATITWKDTNTFLAVSPRFGTFRGCIAEYDVEGRPRHLAYVSLGGHIDDTGDAHYEYRDAERFPPCQTVVVTHDVTGKRIVTTNIVLEYIQGIDPSATTGYVASRFRRRARPLASLILYSNQTAWKIAPAGMLYPVPTASQNARSKVGSHGDYWSASSVVLSTVLGTFAVAVLVTRRANPNRYQQHERMANK